MAAVILDITACHGTLSYPHPYYTQWGKPLPVDANGSWDHTDLGFIAGPQGHQIGKLNRFVLVFHLTPTSAF